MDKEKITIIGGHKFFVRGDGSSGIVPNDEVKVHEKMSNWDKLKAWVEEQKKDRWYSGDAYRYTAYDAVLKKMDEIEGENKNEENK